MRKNRRLLLSLLAIIGMFSFTITAFADDNPIDICKQGNVLKVAQLIGYAIIIAKIVVPVILIVVGLIAYAKAAISNDERELKNATATLVQKAIIAAVVFFVPTIIVAVMSTVEKYQTTKTQFSCFTKCINHPKSCSIPSGGLFN